jgi:hypothetical protein
MAEAGATNCAWKTSRYAIARLGYSIFHPRQREPVGCADRRAHDLAAPDDLSRFVAQMTADYSASEALAQSTTVSALFGVAPFGLVKLAERLFPVVGNLSMGGSGSV